MRKLACFVVFSILCCVACENDDEITFPCSFDRGELIPVYETRVYTEGGRRIKGPEAQAFLKGWHPKYWDQYGERPSDAFVEPKEWIEAFTFISAKEVVFAPNIRLELRHIDGAIVAGEMLPSFGNQFCRFQPEYRFGQDTWVPQYVIRNGYTMPTISMMAFKYVSRNYGADWICYAFFNEFNKEFLKELTQEDTLAVREYYIRFKRVEK